MCKCTHLLCLWLRKHSVLCVFYNERQSSYPPSSIYKESKLIWKASLQHLNLALQCWLHLLSEWISCKLFNSKRERERERELSIYSHRLAGNYFPYLVSFAALSVMYAYINNSGTFSALKRSPVNFRFKNRQYDGQRPFFSVRQRCERHVRYRQTLLSLIKLKRTERLFKGTITKEEGWNERCWNVWTWPCLSLTHTHTHHVPTDHNPYDQEVKEVLLLVLMEIPMCTL